MLSINEPKLFLPFCLVRVIDADTVEGLAEERTQVEIPLLGAVANVVLPLPVIVRLEGIDAPERDTADGKAAIQWVKNWFSFTHAEQALFFATDGKREKYGRWLGDIRPAKDSLTGLTQALLRANYAVPYPRHFTLPWQEY